jgi:hypothetical protein
VEGIELSVHLDRIHLVCSIPLKFDSTEDGGVRVCGIPEWETGDQDIQKLPASAEEVV